MTYEETIKVNKNRLKMINNFLTKEPASESECLGEDETITETAVFPDGTEADIKCCGVQYREGESNTAWTEMVLFRNGSEIGFTEPQEAEFEGRWEYIAENNGEEIRYIVNIVAD